MVPWVILALLAPASSKSKQFLGCAGGAAEMDTALAPQHLVAWLSVDSVAALMQLPLYLCGYLECGEEKKYINIEEI